MHCDQATPAPAHHNVKLGDDVWFCIKGADCEKGITPEFRPAKVLKHWGSGTVNLCVFVDGSHDVPEMSRLPSYRVVNERNEVIGTTQGGFVLPVMHRSSSTYSVAGIVGTWCFPRK